MGRIKCAVVGLGRVGSLLEDDRLREKPCTHAGVINENKDCVLIAGCDIDHKRCDLFKKRWGCENVYTDIEHLFTSQRPDILHVATPPETHLKMVKLAAKYEVKIVICEKPLAENVKEAKEILEIHRSNSITVITNHERRYSSDYLSVKEHINKKRFGKLLSIHARLYMGENKKAYPILLHDGTHMVDIIQFLTGSVLHLKEARLNKPEARETIYIHALSEDIPVFMEVGSGRNYIEFELDISFSKGKIRIGNGLYEEYDSDVSPFYENYRSLRSRKIKPLFKTGYFSNMMLDAVACYKNPDKIPVSSAKDGYLSIFFIEQVRKLIFSHQRLNIFT